MKKGDFIKIEYTGWVSSTGEVFDLTSEEEAKKLGVFNPKHKYGPALVIVGAGIAVPGVEAQLEQMKFGEEKQFEVEPGQAFGNRDPRLIKDISMSKFLEQNINPIPGSFVTIDNRQAKIQSVAGGRVRVDFNHPLASKQLRYKIKIVQEIKSTLEKAKALIEHNNMKCDVDLKETNLTLKFEKKIDLESALGW